MALTEHYEFWYLDPDEEISDFPNTWNYNIDDIDAAIHAAATDPVDLDRLPNLPASQTTSGEFSQERIPTIMRDKLDDGVWDEVNDLIAAAGSGLVLTELGQQDLDDVTKSGLYTQDETIEASLDLNYPVDGAPVMLLVATSERRTWQLAQTFDGQIYARESYNGTWREWTHVNDAGGGSEPSYRKEEIEPDTGEGSVSIERQGPLVFIWGSLYFESEVSANTRVFSIPKWAQTDGICLMPCMTAGADPSNVNLQVSGSSALATADIAEDTNIYGSITFLTTKEMGDEE